MNFKPHAKPPRNAIAIIFDLEGFSRFFNQPDVQLYVGAFLNRVFHAVSTCIEGGERPWGKKKTLGPIKAQLSHFKFMGDGGLYILYPPADTEQIAAGEIEYLCNRLWNLKLNYKEIVRQCADDVPVAELPEKIRFGLARGSIYELDPSSGSQREYIGFPINLASRLQKYCPDLGFIASARLGLSQKELDENGYIRVIATSIRGFPKEIVIVDKAEFEALEEDVRCKLFEKIK